MPILEEKDTSESTSRRNIGLIAAAVAVIVGLSIYLAWPERPLINIPLQKTKKVKQIAFYPAPSENTEIPSTPAIELVPIGEKPRGFPEDLPLYQSEEIIQAYRSYQKGFSTAHTAMIFTTKAEPSEVLEFYRKFLEEKSWITEFQPPQKPQALYAKQDVRSILISTMAYQGKFLINASYVERQ